MKLLHPSPLPRAALIRAAHTRNKISVLNKAVVYVRNNEQTNRLLIVHCHEDEVRCLSAGILSAFAFPSSPICGQDGIPEGFVENVQILDNIYPKLSLDFVTVHVRCRRACRPRTRARRSPTRRLHQLQAPFGPGAVQYVSEEFNIPHNMMFITCPDDHFPHRIAALGGVRVITHS